MVGALTAYWDTTPPAHIQLYRIAAYLGAVPKPEVKQQPEQQAHALMEQFPTAVMPKILTPEEYLEQRNVK